MTTLGFVSLPGGSMAQQNLSRANCWNLDAGISPDTVQPNGTRSLTFDQCEGIAMFDSGGHYVLNSPVQPPKFWPTIGLVGTAEESKAVVQGPLLTLVPTRSTRPITASRFMSRAVHFRIGLELSKGDRSPQWVTLEWITPAHLVAVQLSLCGSEPRALRRAPTHKDLSPAARVLVCADG
jgi:hypothetical protein